MASAAQLAFHARYESERARKRTWTLLWGLALAVAFAASVWVGDVSLGKLARGVPNIADYILRTLPVLRLETLLADIGEWFWGIDQWLVLLADTVLMAYVGTVVGAVFAFALSFLAAGRLSPSPLAHFLSRRVLEVARTVPVLVYALILVYAFGSGPLAGVIALAIHSAGALGKLFAEAAENADLRPFDAVRACGGGWLSCMRFAIVPQVLPDYTSTALLRFEINVREASVLGIVGAGGIGEELYLVVRQFIYADISALVLLILATVAVIDIATNAFRGRLIGAGLAR